MIRIFNHYVHWSSLRGLLFDVGLVLLVAAAAVIVQMGSVNQAVPVAGGHVAAFAVCLLVLNSVSGLYEQAPVTSFGRSAARAVVLLAIALPLAYFIFGSLPAQALNRESVQWAMMAGATALIVRRAYLAHTAAKPNSANRILIFGAGQAAQDVASTLMQTDPNAYIVGHVSGPNERDPVVPANKLLPLNGSLTALVHAHQVDEIVVALTERRAGSMPLRQLLDCKVSGIKVYDLNTHFEKTLGQIRTDYLNASWLIFGDGFNQGAWRTSVKRVFDIFCAMLLLVVSAPVMLATAVIIKLESRGPAFYRQERVGLNGRSFSITKFRSMRTDAEKDGKPQWAAANDSRVTRVGAVIRKLRIDELPQLFNVLSGDMSLVGPRPERPYFVEQLTQELPFYALRHSVKPGVTGWAQVRYAYGATVEDSLQKLQFDLYYVKNHTLFLDLVVLMETVGVVLTGKGAR
ncbi:exopolysaccharide biosynthesis polyprenyl glycosylphosphotransferase [beta proteobacterium AAP121]|nr:exopolysaccharide biosynthesis polyprenyl glycosylphosphotransferase [beta proteobacterium AAP65]KPF98433.1 exopolysaccharide biosynthesis polyprenyl glycosylphosphotransferase [beta proteobacterium AAP121]